MRMLAFSTRNAKEMVRDRLNLMFGIGFPVLVLLLLTLIQSNVPVELFAIQRLAPGIAVFGFSFLSLFSGMLIAKDRESSLMLRLLTSPMRAGDFIAGYTLPVLPMGVAQAVVCFGVALLLGLRWTPYLLLCLAVLLPSIVLFIAIGLLCGSLFTDKQVGGVCGALLTNLCAWMSGTWFDLDLLGGKLKAVADCFPFSHAVDAARAALEGRVDHIMPDLLWVIAYAAVLMAVAVFAFHRKTRGPNL